MKRSVWMFFFVGAVLSVGWVEADEPQRLTDIRLRDPFILPVPKERTYYLYGTGWTLGKGPGFMVYTSKDLVNWEGPRAVFRRPEGFWSDHHYWAPEVHHYKNRYYMFASFKVKEVCRGTQILAADHPAGPFRPLTEKPVTPGEWECLDGTLFVDKAGTPWMVFCHEWVQVGDGEICAQQLSEDLKKAVGKPILLFKASSAKWVQEVGETPRGRVTDGPFMYRSRTGELLMLWSSFGKGGYKLTAARSQSKLLKGPWVQEEKPLYENNGGHGMLFRTFEGDLMLVLHQPNRGSQERPRLFRVEDKGDRLTISPWTGEAPKPLRAELIEVKKIWDRGAHNAFPDLVRWRDRFYCAFREGRKHVSTDGKVRVLVEEGGAWQSTGLIELAGFDLRDAHLTVTPDGRLMLLGGAAPRKTDNERAPTGTFVSFSSDGQDWSPPRIVVEPGRWLWRVTWWGDTAYGVDYGKGQGVDLLVSRDGLHYQAHAKGIFTEGHPNEATLRFGEGGVCYCLLRRAGAQNSAQWGVSRPPYREWRWTDLGMYFGGPNFIRIDSGHWIGGGRIISKGAHTWLTTLDVDKGEMKKLLQLPSGGDTSYPGLVWYRDLLYVSYYASHEGKTSIYLAKVKLILEAK